MNTTFEQISFISEEQKQSEKQTALRLRERLLSEHSLEHFDDTEILSTVLSYANGTKDTAGLVARLLDNFGSLKAVLEARPEMQRGRRAEDFDRKPFRGQRVSAPGDGNRPQL